MNKLVVANHKANLSYAEINSYLAKINQYQNPNIKLVICPSYIYLPVFKKSWYQLGSQNNCAYGSGAYTGEISASQLKSVGVDYGLVGHSERRTNYAETNSEIREKVKALITCDIIPILCIGEPINIFSKTEFLKREINECFKELDQDILTHIVIAYEPIWAIGSNKIPTTNEINKIHQWIKTFIYNEYGVMIKVLYGGSVNQTNINSIISLKTVDGVLIGGASLRIDSFINLLDQIKQYDN